MESMSDVLRSMPFGSIRKQVEERYQTIIQDPLIQKWRSRFPEVTDQDIQLHMNKMYQYVKEYRICRECPGLDHCPNELAGHATRLTVDQVRGQTMIYDQKVACPKYIVRESEESVRRRITSFYVDQASLQRGYDMKEIVRADKERAEAVGRLVDYIDKTKEQGLQSKGLYLEGPLGTGKTFLMCFMLFELAKTGLTGVIVYMPDFAEDLKAMFGEPHKLKETIDMMKETDLLVLDDIGAENMNPWLRDHVLGTILNYRMNRKPTFFTSNYEFGGLEKHFSFTSKDGEEEFKGQRIMDRIRHYVEVIEVHGTNKRVISE
ncbi:MAG: dnaI [Paenibacillaceae bacterium]|jgi:primosomal protein DnaI|nr:dnaI [Paenibacillaceae bacterium]